VAQAAQWPLKFQLQAMVKSHLHRSLVTGSRQRIGFWSLEHKGKPLVILDDDKLPDDVCEELTTSEESFGILCPTNFSRLRVQAGLNPNHQPRRTYGKPYP
jgi:hypothetical protein